MAFDLDAAKAGKAVTTKAGRPVRVIAHVRGAIPSQRVVCLINQEIETYSEDGKYMLELGKASTMDLQT